MPSKKHRPIVMNRNKRPDKTNSILKKAALITAFLAFIEITILVVIHFKNADKATALTADNEKATQKVPGKDTMKDPAATVPKATTVNKITDTAAKKDTVEIRQPVAETDEHTRQKTKKDSTGVQAVKPDETKAAKKLTQYNLFQVLNEVKLEKLRTNNTVKCISIQIIGSSNANNGFEIANYLRKNGYIISGREVVPGSRKGIKIDTGETCIKLSVGDL